MFGLGSSSIKLTYYEICLIIPKQTDVVTCYSILYITDLKSNVGLITWEQYMAHLMVKTIYIGLPQAVSHAAQEITSLARHLMVTAHVSFLFAHF